MNTQPDNKNTSTASPLFSWSAHIITLNRKKTILLMNEASRFPAFALGVNKSDLLRFDLIFTEAVEKSCLAIGIDTSIIEEYLHDGGPLEVLPSTDRKQTARLNQLQSNLRFNINHFGWANMEKIQQLLRNEFGTTQVGMEYFHKSFLAQLETLYGRNPIHLPKVAQDSSTCLRMGKLPPTSVHLWEGWKNSSSDHHGRWVYGGIPS